MGKVMNIDHKEYPKRLRGLPDESLLFIIRDCQRAIAANPDADKVRSGYYADEISYAGMELTRRRKVGK
jgi:hypothetical protein